MATTQSFYRVHKDSFFPAPDWVEGYRNKRSLVLLLLLSRLQSCIPCRAYTAEQRDALTALLKALQEHVLPSATTAEAASGLKHIFHAINGHDSPVTLTLPGDFIKEHALMHRVISVGEKSYNNEGHLLNRFLCDDLSPITNNIRSQITRGGTGEEIWESLIADQQAQEHKRPEARLTILQAACDARDHRNGRDISITDLQASFQLKDMLFGSSTPPAERQLLLNLLFDASTDLTEALNLSASAPGLSGALTYSAGAASFSPNEACTYTRANRKINFSLTNNFGGYTHEFSHAVDHLIAIRMGMPNQFASSLKRPMNPARHICETLAVTSFFQSAIAGDEERRANSRFVAKQYLVTPEEIFARACELWVAYRLDMNNSRNLFLCSRFGAPFSEIDSLAYPSGKTRSDVIEIMETHMPSLLESLDLRVRIEPSQSVAPVINQLDMFFR